MGSLLPERTLLNLNLNLYLSFWKNMFWNYFIDCAETFHLTSLPFFFFFSKILFSEQTKEVYLHLLANAADSCDFYTFHNKPEKQPLNKN